MPTMITIGGRSVDADDPCAMASALRLVRLRVLAGDQEEGARFGQDEVRFTRANIDKLEAEITRLEGLCAAKTPGATRRRFAKSISFR